MLPIAWLVFFLLGNYLLYQIYPELFSTIHLLLETSQETVLTISATAQYACETVQPVLELSYKIDTRAAEQVVELAQRYAPLVEEYFCPLTPTLVVDSVFVVASPLVLDGQQVGSGSDEIARFHFGLGFLFIIAASLLFGVVGSLRNLWSGRSSDRASSQLDRPTPSRAPPTAAFAPRKALVAAFVIDVDSASSSPTRTAITTIELSAPLSASISALTSPKTQFLSLPAFESSVSSITRSNSNLGSPFEQELGCTRPRNITPTVLSSSIDASSAHYIDLSAINFDPTTRNVRSATRSTNAMLAALDDLGADAAATTPPHSTPSIDLSSVNFDPSTRGIRSIKSTGAMLAALEDLEGDDATLSLDATISIELSSICYDPSTRDIRSTKSTGAMLAALDDPLEVGNDTAAPSISAQALGTARESLHPTTIFDSFSAPLSPVQKVAESSNPEGEICPELNVAESASVSMPTSNKIVKPTPRSLESTKDDSTLPLKNQKQSAISPRSPKAKSEKSPKRNPYPTVKETRRNLIDRHHSQKKTARKEEEKVADQFETVSPSTSLLRKAETSPVVKILIEVTPAPAKLPEAIKFGAGSEANNTVFLPRTFTKPAALSINSSLGRLPISHHPQVERMERKGPRADENGFTRASRSRFRVNLVKRNFVECRGGKRRKILDSYEGYSKVLKFLSS